MKKITAALAASALALGGVAVMATAAEAHTPAISASCSGVHVTGTNYDASKTNTWFVVIDGVTKSGTFAGSLDVTVPVPQDGKTHTYGAQVADADQTPAYTKAANGPVGPCGTPAPPVPPKPADRVVEASSESQDCTTDVVTVHHSTETYGSTLDVKTNTWVEDATPVHADLPDTTRPKTDAEKAACAPPTKVDEPQTPTKTAVQLDANKGEVMAETGVNGPLVGGIGAALLLGGLGLVFRRRIAGLIQR